MTSAQPGRTWTVTGAVRHHLLVVLLLVALALASAALAVATRPPTYQGTTLLFIDDRYSSSRGFDLAVQAGELLSAHYVQLATSRPVLAAVCAPPSRPVRPCTPESLLGRVSANTVKGTSMIAINARAPDPASAAALANEVAGAIVKENQKEIDRLVRPTATYLDAEIDQLGKEIAAQQAALAQLAADTTPAGRAQAVQIQASLALLQARYANAYQKREDLLLSRYEHENSLSVFQAATPPAAPYDPQPALYLAAGALAGLIAGVALALLLERLDDRLLTVEDLVQATGAPVGVAVPREDGKQAARDSTRHYALARAHILAHRPDLRRVLVAAAADGDRSHPVAIHLGAVAARAGQRVLVVDAEGKGAVSQPPADGSIAVLGALDGARPPGDVKPVRPRRGVRDAAAPSRLDFLTLGPEGSTELLAGRAAGYDLTVVASPSPSSHAAGIYLARTADVTVLVATVRSTTFRDAQRAAEALGRTGIEIVAAILVGGRPAEGWEGWELESEQVVGAPLAERLPSWRGPAIV